MRSLYNLFHLLAHLTNDCSPGGFQKKIVPHPPSNKLHVQTIKSIFSSWAKHQLIYTNHKTSLLHFHVLLTCRRRHNRSVVTLRHCRQTDGYSHCTATKISIPIYIPLKITDNISQYQIRDEIIIFFTGSISRKLSSPIQTSVSVDDLINTAT